VAEDFFQALVRDPVEPVGVVRVLFYVIVVQQVAHGLGVLHTVGVYPGQLRHLARLHLARGLVVKLLSGGVQQPDKGLFVHGCIVPYDT
jgi:hypothetical protein